MAAEIVCAARKTFLDLFKNGERYYYCALCTTGEGHAPCVSAWSWEALERQAAKQTNCDISERASLIQWSYADSPYYCYGEDHFSNVQQCFNKRPSIPTIKGEKWQQELAVRLAAMELAMKKLDEEGLFEVNQARDSVLEVMPPEGLNNQSSTVLQQWLLEAAE